MPARTSTPVVSRITALGPIHRLAYYFNGRLELWLTPCIVTMPPPDCHCLIVPSNERLVGTQFSHFPVGGPTPSAPLIGVPPTSTATTTTTTAKSPVHRDKILYASETVDGTVTEYGGFEFEKMVKQLPLDPTLSQEQYYPIRCPTGQARTIPSVGYLTHNFETLILAVAPFYESHDDDDASACWKTELQSAYRNAFKLAHGTVATPLLGAGARGIPVEEAAQVATDSIVSFLKNNSNNNNNNNNEDEGNNDKVDIIRMCVLEEEVAEIIHDNLEDYGE